MATKLIAAVVIVLSTTIFHLAMGLTVEITSQKYTDAFTGKVTIGCVLELLDECREKAPMVVGLGKDGETQLAFVQQPSTIDYYIDPAQKYHAQGHLDKDTYTGYLNVSVSSPDHTDSGRYTCVIFCRYATGVLQEVQASENLSVEIVDLGKALENLQNQFTSLQSELTAKDSAIDAIDARMTSLETKAWTQSPDLANLTDRLDTVKATGENLSEESYTYFTAGLITNVEVSQGETIVFNKVLANEGNAYNSWTGLFKAPKDGLYVFLVTLMPSCIDCRVWASIMENNREVARLYGWDLYSWDQTSTSYVSLLDQGDTVKVVAHGRSKLYGGRQYNLFSGFLVR